MRRSTRGLGDLLAAHEQERNQHKQSGKKIWNSNLAAVLLGTLQRRDEFDMRCHLQQLQNQKATESTQQLIAIMLAYAMLLS